MTSKVYVFHKTVRGQMHIQTGLPCQDASGSFSFDNGKKQYYIAAVADGHGSSSCFRSGTGSKIAVDVAIECLKACAETWLENIKKFNSRSPDASLPFQQDPFKQPFRLRQVTDTIIARWYDRVMTHYSLNPLTPEEKQAHPDAGKRIAHVYGTTLIAALWMSSWLILIQQGDGRCDVFYQDGHTDQPIPWDERCQDNVTTSMCDADAAVSIRSCLINSVKCKPIACFLESDGVEDSYRDTYENLGGSHTRMGGVKTFNKSLIGRILHNYGKPEEFDGAKKFEQALERRLNLISASGQFGRGGSGDDVSVAGIVNFAEIDRYKAAYKADVERYERDEDIFWLEDALRSKTRKLGVLEQRRQKAWRELQAGAQADESVRRTLQRQFADAEKEYSAFKAEYDKIRTQRDELAAQPLPAVSAQR